MDMGNTSQKHRHSILFLLNEGFDTPGPSNHLVSALIEDLLKVGFFVSIIESHRTGKNPDIPDNLINYPNLEVRVAKRPIVKKDKFVKRYFEEASFAFKCRKMWKDMNNIDAVFVQSCPTAIFPIYMCKRSMNCPIIYNIQDMFPGSTIASGVMPQRWMRIFFFLLQKIAYKQADYITVISDDMKQKAIEQGVPENKITTIVNWYDDQTVHEVPWEENRFVKKYDLSRDKYYVQYAGTIGYVFDYKAFIYVAEKFKNNKKISFQIIAQGSQLDAFIAEAKEKKLVNICFYPLEPQNMVSDVYSACSVCLIPLKEGVIGNSVPSKAGLLMACRRAVINSVDPGTDYYRMFNDNNIGISVPNDKGYEDLVYAIQYLYDNADIREQMATAGQAFGKTLYARSTNTAKYVNLLSSICEDKK